MKEDLGTLISRWKKGFKKIRQREPEWTEFAGADWLDQIMTVEVTDKLFKKQGRTIARWTLPGSDERQLVVFLKRHYILRRKDGLKAVLFPHSPHSPGLEEWDHLEWAEKQGFPVPRAMAAGEFLQPGGKIQGFIAIEELANMLPLHEAVPLAYKTLSPVEFRRWKHSLNRELVRLSYEFHRRHTYHRDWYFCHFYIDEADTQRVPEQWQQRVRVIDFHRMAKHRWARWGLQSKDLAQLLYSSDVPGVSDRDRLEFWALYKGYTRFPRLIRWWARTKWRLYQRHDAPKG
jgi:hypothetical protein